MGDFLSNCNHRNEDDITVAKLCFPAFSWNVWCERNYQIFRNKARPWEAALHDTKAQIRSRANYLKLEVSSHILAVWDLSAHSSHTLTKPIPFVSFKDNFTVGFFRRKSNSILWIKTVANGDPFIAASAFLKEASKYSNSLVVLADRKSISSTLTNPNLPP